MHYLQPDYIFVSGGDTRRFWNVVFRWPQYHDLDHQAVIATIRMGKRRLTAYRRKCQKFPLQLPPQELRDDLTQVFEELKVICEEPTAAKHHWRNWMRDSTWLLIRQCTSLHRAGQLSRCVSQRMQRTIYAVLKRDRTACMAQVGESIVAKLAKGNVHEAFCHLKGWYWSATDTQARPCYQTMWKSRRWSASSYTGGATHLVPPSPLISGYLLE